MIDSLKKFNDLKTLYYLDDEIFNLYFFLKTNSKYGDGASLIITPTPESSEKVFKKLLSQLGNSIDTRHKNYGNRYELILKDNEKIIIQDIPHLIKIYRHFDGMRIKNINFNYN